MPGVSGLAGEILFCLAIINAEKMIFGGGP
jgi:hypothetical protein